MFSCSQDSGDDTVADVKTIDIVSLGTSNYGGIVIGGRKDAAIQVTNSKDEAVKLNLDEQIQPPFYVVSRSSDCLDDVIEKNRTCTISIRFSPTEEGEFSLVFKVDDKTVTLEGVGLVSGVLQLDDTNWEVGESAAGIIRTKNFKLKNLGDLTVKTPVFTLPNYITLGFNECGSFIAAKAECTFSLEAQMTEARSYSDTLRFESEDGGPVEILLTAEIVPATPSGLVRFVEVPESMSSDGQEFVIKTQPITDAFNNVVVDGTLINVNANSNLLILTGNQYETESGVIEFRIRTKTIKGNGTISVTSDQANGFISFPITAGEPFGSMSFSTEVPEIPANGLTQIILSTDTIFDQYDNIVEDGTPIYFQMVGDATISSGADPKRFSSVTINGKTSVVVQAGRIAEVGTLKVFGGPIYNELNEIVGYRANGEINITFVPGPADGVIPVNSSLTAIYSDNNPPPDITIPTQTLVTIGPLKDANNNIVKEGTTIVVNIEEGFNVSGAIPESSFNLQTDSEGYATFTLIGNNKRGYITINASSSLAQGSAQVWGYLRKTLRYSSTNDNVEAYFKHHSAGQLPSPLLPWGKAEQADNSGELDGIYYGFQKLSDVPTTSFGPNQEFPFFNWDCFFGAGDDLIGNFCMQQDETYFPMIRYTRTNALRFDAPEGNPSPELVQNTDFNLSDKLDFWGGIIDNPYGAKWSSAHNGTLWIDNRNPINPDSGEQKNRGISDWISIDKNKKYLLKFTMRDQIGDNDKRYGVVGIIEGDINLINDPAYELPPPIILKDDYFGVEIDGIVQRLVYTPTGDSTVVKIFFSTRGAGNRAEIKFDNISFKELNTQNIHDNNSTEGVSVAYMEELDTALMFGGNDLIRTSYTCEPEPQTYTNSINIADNLINLPASLSFNSFVTDTEIYDLNLNNNGSATNFSFSLTGDAPDVDIQENCFSRASNRDPCILRVIYQPQFEMVNETKLLKVNGRNINLTFSSRNKEAGKCYNYAAQSSNRTTLLKRIEDQSVGILVNTYGEDSNFDLGSEPSPMGHMAVTSLPEGVYGFGGYTSGGFGSASDSLMYFDGKNIKWQRISAQGDPDLPEEEQMPSPRYQNGILYVPELNNLYVMGGTSQNPEQASDWFTNDDFWKLDLDESQLAWKQICNDCNLFPDGIYPNLGRIQNSLESFPDYPGKFDEYMDTLNNLKRTNAIWHSATQKAYLIIPESDVVSLFDPFAEIFNTVPETDGMYILRDSFQITYNNKTGRTYGYKQGNPLLDNSTLWQWDMNRDEKQYLRYQFNLAETAKQFVQELNIAVYAYGNSMTYRLERNYSIDGIEVYLFDHDSETWVSIGFNQARSELDAQIPIEFSVDLPISAQRFVSDEGKLDLLITPRGRPGFNGGEPLMGNDLDPVNIGEDGFGRIEEVKDVSSGGNYSCALLMDGKVKCWGRNDYGQLGLGLSTPAVGESVNEMGDFLREAELFDINNQANAGLIVEKVFSGPFHSCALFNNKRIKCWGRNDYGQLGFQSNNTVVGDGFGEMADDLPFINLGTVDFTEGGDFVEVVDVVIGDLHTCAYLKVNIERDVHKVKCWGRNNYGQLGYGDNVDRGLNPAQMGNNLPFINFGTVFDNEIAASRPAEVFGIASGKNHMCANIENDDSQSIKKLTCWGHNAFSQLGIEDQNGDPDLSNRNSPTLTDIRTYDIYTIDGGGDHTCMYYNNNLRDESFCWGRNDYGQLGRGGSDEPLLLDLPVNLEFEFRDADNTSPLPVISDQSQGVFPDPDATFRKMTKFDDQFNPRIQFDHLNSHNIADQDFIFEFEIDPQLDSKIMPILSKIALSTGVYDSSQITQTGGWIVRINDLDKLEFYVEGVGVVGKSVSLDEGYQKIRVQKTLDADSGKQRIKFFRNTIGEWNEITDLSFTFDLDGLNLSNNTDAPLVIGSNFDESPVIGPQRTKFFNGFIGYVFMEIGNANIQFQPGSIPSSDLLSSFVDLGEGIFVREFSIGEDHSCAILTDGRSKCWGRNNYGQTGYNYTYDDVGSNLNDMGENLNFVEVGLNDGDFLPIQKMTSGYEHNCVLIENDNLVKCWGYNGFGQLGQEDQRHRGRGEPLERGENKLFIDSVTLEGIF